MARLAKEVRIFIVQRNAGYDSPSAVVEAVKKRFGVSVPKQTVEAHDPTKTSGKGLAQKWVDLFNQSREKFMEDVSAVAISHKSVRLRRLDRLAQRAEESGNMVLLMRVLEQAAKEMGGYYSNKRKFDHSAIQPDVSPTSDLPRPNMAAVDSVLQTLVG